MKLILSSTVFAVCCLASPMASTDSGCDALCQTFATLLASRKEDFESIKGEYFGVAHGKVWETTVALPGPNPYCSIHYLSDEHYYRCQYSKLSEETSDGLYRQFVAAVRSNFPADAKFEESFYDGKPAFDATFPGEQHEAITIMEFSNYDLGVKVHKYID